MKLEVEIYKEKFHDYRWRGFLNTGINTIEVKSDARFCWTHRKHVKDYLDYMCKTLNWKMETIG